MTQQHVHHQRARLQQLHFPNDGQTSKATVSSRCFIHSDSDQHYTLYSPSHIFRRQRVAIFPPEIPCSCNTYIKPALACQPLESSDSMLGYHTKQNSEIPTQNIEKKQQSLATIHPPFHHPSFARPKRNSPPLRTEKLPSPQIISEDRSITSPLPKEP